MSLLVSSGGAHGYDSKTAEELNAYTNDNRPTADMYCSDCLALNGVGSETYFDRQTSVWRQKGTGLLVTTDVLTFFRSLATSGRDVFADKVVFHQQSSAPFGQAATFANGGSVRQNYDGRSVYWSTGTSSAIATVADAAYNSVLCFGPVGRLAMAAAYVCEDVWFSNLSDATEEYSYRRGFLNPAAATLGPNEAGLLYDRGNALGLGNTGNSPNWITYTRAGTVNTIGVTNVIPATAIANRQRIEVLLTLGKCRFFIAGTELPELTTNVPADLAANFALSSKSALIRSVGSSERVRNATRRFFGIYYA